jgi:hypothetical protein
MFAGETYGQTISKRSANDQPVASKRKAQDITGDKGVDKKNTKSSPGMILVTMIVSYYKIYGVIYMG